MNAHYTLSLSASSILAFAALNAQACNGLDVNGNECDIAVTAVEVNEGTWSRMSAHLLAPPAALPVLVPKGVPGQGATKASDDSSRRLPVPALCSGAEGHGMHLTGNDCALDDGPLEVDATTWGRMAPRILGRQAVPVAVPAW